MSVYIDQQIPCSQNRNWKYNFVTHLFADTETELHEFAMKIGLKRKWFQLNRTVNHYDLSPNKRELAITHGVIVLSIKDAVTKWKEIRNKQ